MVPYRPTLRTAYVEHMALTPVAQPIDRARFRFKRLYLALIQSFVWTDLLELENSRTRDNLMPLDSLKNMEIF